MLSIIIILVHVLVTRLCYRDLVLHFFFDPIQEIASYIGFRIFAPLRKWTFGAGYNHPAVVLQPFFLLGLLHLITLICISWVGTHNKANLKLLSGLKNIKINMAGLF